MAKTFLVSFTVPNTSPPQLISVAGVKAGDTLVSVLQVQPTGGAINSQFPDYTNQFGPVSPEDGMILSVGTPGVFNPGTFLALISRG